MIKLLLNYFVFAGILTTGFMIRNSQNILDLQSNKEIEIEVKGNPGSTHYHAPLLLSLKNDTRDIKTVNIPAGLWFKSDNNRIQDIITTENIVVKVAPNSSKSIPLKGLCIQASNGSPNSKEHFKLDGYAPSSLRQLATFISKNDVNESSAQHAMWVLSDQHDLETAIGLDSKNEQALINKTAQLASLPKIDIAKYNELKKRRLSPTYSSSLKGYFKWEFPKSTKVQIAIFNDQNVLIKEVFNQEVEAGFQKMDYELETTAYEGQKITAQMIAFNKVVARRTINLHQAGR